MSEKFNDEIGSSSSGNPELSIPNWLNSDFVAIQLKNHFNDDRLRIVRFEICPAMANGETFTNRMYRVIVTFSLKTNKTNRTTRGLFVKSPVLNEAALAVTCPIMFTTKRSNFTAKLRPNSVQC